MSKDGNLLKSLFTGKGFLSETGVPGIAALIAAMCLCPEVQAGDEAAVNGHGTDTITHVIKNCLSPDAFSRPENEHQTGSTPGSLLIIADPSDNKPEENAGDETQPDDAFDETSVTAEQNVQNSDSPKEKGEKKKKGKINPESINKAFATPDIKIKSPKEISKTVYSREAVAAHSSISILLDPGHDYENYGAVSTEYRVSEFVLNHNLALKLEKELRKRGYSVDFTRTLLEKSPLKNRVAKIRKHDILVSLHHDSVHEKDCEWTKNMTCRTDRANGYCVLISDENPQLRKSYRLSYAISSYLKNSRMVPNLYNRNDKRMILVNDDLAVYDRRNLYILRRSSIPAVLLETAVITNPRDEEMALNPDFQDRYVKAVADGIDAYFEAEK